MSNESERRGHAGSLVSPSATLQIVGRGLPFDLPMARGLTNDERGPACRLNANICHAAGCFKPDWRQGPAFCLCSPKRPSMKRQAGERGWMH